jgi:glycosyltransferase involved in cell wall biosynthesis
MIRNLTLFFTRGVSLRTWSMLGMLEREVAIYRRLIQHGFQVSFVTYGDASDLEFADKLGGIQVLCNATGMPLEQYESLLVSVHGDALKQRGVIKTNQTFGGELALQTARELGRPFVARCGYMWSLNAAREHGEDSPAAAEARRVEERVFGSADRIVVTTDAMRMNVVQRMPHVADRITVIPNYVDTDLFRPLGQMRDELSLVFIGRIAPEKNLAALLAAIRPLAVKLTLIGEGKLRPELQRQSADLDGRVTWEGNVPNSQLPEYVNRAGIFVLLSLYEGHPKALLEAMACGVAVIGADSPGIREVIRHGETGYLCGTDPVSIRAALEDLLRQPELVKELGRNARQYVVEHYSLDRIFNLESALLHEVAARQCPPDS